MGFGWQPHTPSLSASILAIIQPSELTELSAENEASAQNMRLAW